MKTPMLPRFPLPKFDVDALYVMQKANVDALVQAQQIMVDAMQAAAKLQYGWMKDGYATVQAVMDGKFDVEKKPDAYVAEFKTVAEKAMAVAQSQVDLGMKAQAEALDVLTKRVGANVDQAQKFAA